MRHAEPTPKELYKVIAVPPHLLPIYARFCLGQSRTYRKMGCMDEARYYLNVAFAYLGAMVYPEPVKRAKCKKGGQ